MENKHGKSTKLYLSLLGAVAVLCLVASVLWMLRGQSAPEAPLYLLKDNAGHIALYAGDGTGPLAQYEEIYTHLLPESDVLALQQGVPVYTETELQKRLEDYGL